MIYCDLCGQSKECRPKEIEGREYDICAECWEALSAKLKGKGRAARKRERVFLPPIVTEPEPQDPKPPMQPPKIWGSQSRTQQ